MENFNAKEYRDNLAKDLKEIRKTDPEKAKKVLEEAKKTEEYDEAVDVRQSLKVVDYTDDIDSMIQNELDNERKFNSQENKEHGQMPIIGSEIYIPREESFDYPLDDIDGGIATIKTIDGPKDGLVHKQDYIIEVNEIPGRKFSWKRLLELQDALSREFAGKIAKPNPDTNVYPEENDWKGGSQEDFQKWINRQ